jgi:hypothetical protein
MLKDPSLMGKEMFIMQKIKILKIVLKCRPRCSANI